MQVIYEQQDLTPADVERLRAARQEHQRMEEGLEREVEAIDADIWKDEMGIARMVEQVKLAIVMMGIMTLKGAVLESLQCTHLATAQSNWNHISMYASLYVHLVCQFCVIYIRMAACPTSIKSFAYL